MPLHERVGEIFLANETDEVQAAFSASLARFRVEDAGIIEPDTDTVRNELRVVLLVESPHTHEVCHHYPLAGSRGTNAGRIVRDKLMDCGLNFPEQPVSIGQLVHDRHNAVQALGIMNVSQLPFQDTAYDCTPWVGNDCRCRPEWPNYIRRMKTIKNGPDVCADARRTAECRRLDEEIAGDLGRRLRYLYENNPDVLLVRCGEVAQAFYGKTGIDMPHTCDLPHPNNLGSEGERWQDLNCQNECLQNIIGRVGPPPAGA